MRPRRAVTIIELLVTILIVAILAITIFFSLTGSVSEADDAAIRHELSLLQTKLDLAYAIALQESSAMLETPIDAWVASLPAGKIEALVETPDNAISVKQAASILSMNVRVENAILAQIMLIEGILEDWYARGFVAVRVDGGLLAVYVPEGDERVQIASLVASKTPFMYLDIGRVFPNSGIAIGDYTDFLTLALVRVTSQGGNYAWEPVSGTGLLESLATTLQTTLQQGGQTATKTLQQLGLGSGTPLTKETLKETLSSKNLNLYGQLTQSSGTSGGLSLKGSLSGQLSLELGLGSSPTGKGSTGTGTQGLGGSKTSTTSPKLPGGLTRP